MENNYFFSNKSFDNFKENEIDNNSIFNNNKEDNLLPSYNNEEEYPYDYNNINDNNIIDNNELSSNELFSDPINNTKYNLNIDNTIHFKNNFLQENNSIKDISSIEQIFPNKKEDDSELNNNSSSANISENSSSTKDKSRLKNDKSNNINKTNDLILKDKGIIKEKDKDKEKLNKKRKPRVHLEDLDLDPNIIKNKKYETIGDKVFLSKNKILTDEDKKEIRAIRNRISAQKSRDRKKAEFSLFKNQIKYLTELLNQKILIIQNYEKECCPQCRSKMQEINQKLLSEKNDINLNKENNDDIDNGLILEEEENPIIANNNNSLLSKIPGLLIGLVCLLCITLCIIQINSNKNNLNNIQLRNLKNFKNNNKSIIINITNLNDTNDETFEIYEEPISPRNKDYSKEINEIKEDNELLQMCHDKFIFDVLSNMKKKKDIEERQKTGFLVKKLDNKFDPNSFCFESNKITNGDYIINNNNFTNTLPIRRDNIILNDYISSKIISIFIKDYEALYKFSNGKILSLKEQIENGVKNSEDGCIYLQLVIPKNDYDKRNNTCPNEDARFFEIRCKVLSYYNYYNRDV